MSTLPEYLMPQSITVRDIKPANSVSARSGFTQRLYRGAQYWEFDVVWPPYQERNHRQLMGFLSDQDGIVEPFEFVLPSAEPLGTAAGVPVVNGAHTKGDNTISTRGWFKNSRVLLRGDLVRIKQKVYRLRFGAKANASGIVTLKIQPGVYQDLSDGEGVVAKGISFRCHVVSPTLETVYIPAACGILYQTRALLREDAF